jgi:hypothetical protein
MSLVLSGSTIRPVGAPDGGNQACEKLLQLPAYDSALTLKRSNRPESPVVPSGLRSTIVLNC